MLVLVAALNGDWPMWGGDPTHTQVQGMPGAMSSAPVVRWFFTATYQVERQLSAIADLDGDGNREIVFCDLEGWIFCVDGATGSLKWSKDLGCYPSSPAVGDIDNDGEKEVITVNTNGLIYCFSPDGNVEWQVQMASAWQGIPTIADPDGDGELEVLVGNDSGELYCLSGDGGVEWVDTLTGWIRVPPAVGDIDGDGEAEVVIGTSSKLYSLSGSDGGVEWAVSTGDHWFNAPAIADADGDGEVEVVDPDRNGVVRCLSGDGTLEWQTSLDPVYIQTTPAVADVDGDGIAEIFVGNDSAKVYSLEGSDGSVNWVFRTEQKPSSYVHGLSLADVDGDGKLELLVSNSVFNNPIDTIYCLNAEDGGVQWQVGIAGDPHGAFTGDVDGDGLIEIVDGTARDSALWVLDTESLEAKESSRPFRLRQLGKRLVMDVGESSFFEIKAYDPSGRLKAVIFRGHLPAGRHEFPVPKGISIISVNGKALLTSN